MARWSSLRIVEVTTFTFERLITKFHVLGIIVIIRIYRRYLYSSKVFALETSESAWRVLISYGRVILAGSLIILPRFTTDFCSLISRSLLSVRINFAFCQSGLIYIFTIVITQYAHTDIQFHSFLQVALSINSIGKINRIKWRHKSTCKFCQANIVFHFWNDFFMSSICS